MTTDPQTDTATICTLADLDKAIATILSTEEDNNIALIFYEPNTSDTANPLYERAKKCMDVESILTVSLIEIDITQASKELKQKYKVSQPCLVAIDKQKNGKKALTNSHQNFIKKFLVGHKPGY